MLHVVAMLDVDTVVLELLKLVQVRVRDVELMVFVMVEMAVLGANEVVFMVVAEDDVTFVALEVGMGSVDEKEVVDVFHFPVVHDVVMIVPDEAVPLEVELKVVLAVMVVDEGTVMELLLVDKIDIDLVEVISAVEVGSSVQDVEMGVVLLVHGPVILEDVDESITGPVPEELVELTPVPWLEVNSVVVTVKEELVEKVAEVVTGLVILVHKKRLKVSRKHVTEPLVVVTVLVVLIESIDSEEAVVADVVFTEIDEIAAVLSGMLDDVKLLTLVESELLVVIVELDSVSQGTCLLEEDAGSEE